MRFFFQTALKERTLKVPSPSPFLHFLLIEDATTGIYASSFPLSGMFNVA